LQNAGECIFKPMLAGPSSMDHLLTPILVRHGSACIFKPMVAGRSPVDHLALSLAPVLSLSFSLSLSLPASLPPSQSHTLGSRVHARTEGESQLWIS
jgi:hypothetical protein